jgi:hypothetical protein
MKTEAFDFLPNSSPPKILGMFTLMSRIYILSENWNVKLTEE